MKYNLKDHLGNVRMVINSAGTVKQSNNYYPFGGIFSQFSSTDNKYQFGGKELQEGTDWLDFGARMYQSELGRWLCFDPMAEKAHNWTPYRYCFNNPMNVIDPTGLYEWKYDMDYNTLKYVSDWGGPSSHMVHNFMSGSLLNTVFMDSWEFENIFGIHQEQAKYFSKGGSKISIFTSRVDRYEDFVMDVSEVVSHISLDRNVYGARSQGGGDEDGWAVSAAAGYLIFLQADLITPEPSDAAWPKWVGHAVLTGASAIVLYSAGKDFADYMSKGGRGNIWPDLYPRPNPADIDWSLSDSQLATGVTGGGVSGGPGSDWNKIKKWFRDTRRKINGNLK